MNLLFFSCSRKKNSKRAQKYLCFDSSSSRWNFFVFVTSSHLLTLANFSWLNENKACTRAQQTSHQISPLLCVSFRKPSTKNKNANGINLQNCDFTREFLGKTIIRLVLLITALVSAHFFKYYFLFLVFSADERDFKFLQQNENLNHLCVAVVTLTR